MNLTMKFCPNCSSSLVKENIDGRRRLRCSKPDTCKYVFWNNPTPVVAMVVETKEGIVLAHNKMAPPGIFSIITGFLEMGETPEFAARRETKEELGLEVTTINLIGIFPFSRAGQIIMAYNITAEGSITLNEELDEYKIVQKEQLLDYEKEGRFEVQLWLDKLQVLK